MRAFESGMRVVMSSRQAARCALRLASSLSEQLRQCQRIPRTEPQSDDEGMPHGEPPFTAWQLASEKG